MSVVYLDSVFLLNVCMDYLILLLTARLSGIPLRRRRYLAAAAIGGLYAVAVYFPGWGFLQGSFARLTAGILLAAIAFGGEERFARLLLLMLAVSCGFAGCVLGAGLLRGSRFPADQGIFYADTTLCILGVSVAAAYGGMSLIFRAAGHDGIQGNLIPVRVSVCGRMTELTALRDSGNSLREEPSERPVLVMESGALRHVLPKEVAALLTEEHLKHPEKLPESIALFAPSLSPRLLPFRAVGVSGGLLLAIQTDWVEICGERMERIYAAISPTNLGKGYGALWGGAVKRGGRYGNSWESAAKDL